MPGSSVWNVPRAAGEWTWCNLLPQQPDLQERWHQPLAGPDVPPHPGSGRRKRYDDGNPSRLSSRNEGQSLRLLRHVPPRGQGQCCQHNILSRCRDRLIKCDFLAHILVQCTTCRILPLALGLSFRLFCFVNEYSLSNNNCLWGWRSWICEHWRLSRYISGLYADFYETNFIWH